MNIRAWLAIEANIDAYLDTYQGVMVNSMGTCATTPRSDFNDFFSWPLEMKPTLCLALTPIYMTRLILGPND